MRSWELEVRELENQLTALLSMTPFEALRTLKAQSIEIEYGNGLTVQYSVELTIERISVSSTHSGKLTCQSQQS